MNMNEINPRVFWDLVVQNLRVIAIVVVVMAVLLGGATIIFTEDSYSSKCSMYVMNITKDAAGQTTGISTSGLEASQRMVNEYITILRSDSVLLDVQETLKTQGYRMSISQIRSALSMAAVDDTAMLQITATTGNPNMSKAVCDALQERAPARVNEVMLGIGTITVVDIANAGTKKAPDTARNAVFGGLIGFVLSYGICLVNHLMDNTIKDEKDIKTKYNVNVLGVVPNFNAEPEKKKKRAAKERKGVKSNG